MSHDPTHGLTTLQRDTFLVLQELGADGRSPTIRELCVELDVNSTSQVLAALDVLAGRGWISKVPNRWRGIHLLRSMAIPEEPVFVLASAASE